MKKKQVLVKELPLEERIIHLLNEIRIVLPGTQAILGFQFASVFTDHFQRISQELRDLHLISLSCVTLSIIFLLGAPAYNRIVEKDKATEHFHSFASNVVLVALLLLSVGMSLELYVIGTIASGTRMIPWVLSIFSLIASLTLWFGYSWYNKKKIHE